MKLPWSEEKVNNDKLMYDEMSRLLLKLKTLDPTSDEYSKCVVRFKYLHDQELELKKIKSSRRTKIVESLITIGLFVGLNTMEQWAPVTSKWGNVLSKPFRFGKNNEW